jgi:hypothetical protein
VDQSRQRHAVYQSDDTAVGLGSGKPKQM